MTAPAGQHDALHKKWCEWLEEIKRQVHIMFHNRAIWREMREALRCQDDGVFLVHYSHLYVAGQVMAVRRLADPRADGPTVSLGRLLSALGRNPSVMNRDRYVAMHTAGCDDEDYWTKCAQAIFDEHFGDSKGQFCLDKNCDRMKRLTATSQAIGGHADRSVAHIDSRKRPGNLTYKDLDRAIDEVGDLLRDVTLLLKAVRLYDVEPTILWDWKRPFRQPLF